MIKLQFREDTDRFVGVTGALLTIGRDRSNDLVIDETSVSDFHAEVRQTASGLEIVDLLSASGTFVNDVRVAQRHTLAAWDVLRLGSVELEINDPSVHRPRDWALRGQSDLLAGQFLTIRPTTLVGRGSDCDLVIEDVSLSRHHAELTVTESRLRVRDLGSANGTFVNGDRIRDGQLAHDDRIRFGNREFLVVAPIDLVKGRERVDDTTEVQGNFGDRRDGELETEILTGSALKAQLVEQTNVLGPGWRLQIDKSPLRLGRNADNEVIVADVSVSRVHAELSLRGYRWQIEDLHSSNGVHVNGERVQVARLRDGDLIGIGRVEFLFQVER